MTATVDKCVRFFDSGASLNETRYARGRSRMECQLVLLSRWHAIKVLFTSFPMGQGTGSNSFWRRRLRITWRTTVRTIASTLWFDWKTLMSDALSVQSGMAGGPTGGTACDLSPVSFVAKRDTVVDRISIRRRSWRTSRTSRRRDCSHSWESFFFF